MDGCPPRKTRSLHKKNASIRELDEPIIFGALSSDSNRVQTSLWHACLHNKLSSYVYKYEKMNEYFLTLHVWLTSTNSNLSIQPSLSSLSVRLMWLFDGAYFDIGSRPNADAECRGESGGPSQAEASFPSWDAFCPFGRTRTTQTPPPTPNSYHTAVNIGY